jgi:hypothetical protein
MTDMHTIKSTDRQNRIRDLFNRTELIEYLHDLISLGKELGQI